MPTAPLTKLVYKSKRLTSAADDLHWIIDVSRKNNKSGNITGALIHDRSAFMQLLEGERSEIAECFLRISNSAMHSNIEVACVAPSTVRLFTNWRMALAKFDIEDMTINRLWGRIMATPSSERLPFIEEQFLRIKF